MTDGDRPNPTPPRAWNSAITEPLPMPADARPPAPGSPDSSGSIRAADAGPKKLAEVKRSAEVESLLEGLSYARPHVTMQRSETDGALFAAHSSGPRAVPAAVQTPTLEPPLMLSHSLVEAIANPSPQPPRVAAITTDERELNAHRRRAGSSTTVVLARTSYRRLAIAFVPCAVVAAFFAYIFGRATAPTRSPVVVDPAAVLAPDRAPPTRSAASSVAAPPLPTDLPPIPPPEAAAEAPEPVAAPAHPDSAPRPPQVPAAAHPAAPAKGAHPAPAGSGKNDSSSLHNDFEVQN